MPVVRDFSRESIGDVLALANRQRSIVNVLVKVMPDGGWEGPANDKKTKLLKKYVLSHITQHVSEALQVKSSPDLDAMRWLESSNDPFLGLVCTRTAICLGGQELASWANKYENEGSNLNASRLLACAAFANLTETGMVGMTSGSGSANSNAGLALLEKALVLLSVSSSSISNKNEEEAQKWLSVEFNCSREMFIRIGFGDPRYVQYRDRAVLLGRSLRNMSPGQLAGLGTVQVVYLSCYYPVT